MQKMPDQLGAQLKAFQNQVGMASGVSYLPTVSTTTNYAASNLVNRA